ncbi:conjugated bile salt MFS transporter [Zhenhengia yiwuensis]|uniref:conjugated bile salt MFS transporter n=1 Tax=Zhenhengia yiwuensis TaxID=2763666 RepID=UPI002A758768|nr:conjugated bile salt MFS transporter [Zhenhengia yiwuensis]MDY3367302.1 conjugated bile salt MFS transporter [Zhenhengia yiwuensis]
MDHNQSNIASPNRNIKKAYFIVFVCMIMQAIPFGVAQNIQPLFIPYVTSKFDFSLASFSLIFTFGAIASAICSPFLGKLYGKVNIKFLFLIGVILSSLGFMGFSFARKLYQFDILSAVSQVGCIMFSGLGVPFIISHWFPNNGKGKALGIAFSGGSIGNVFLQPITSHLLAASGPSTSYIIFGLLSLIVGIPLVIFFIRLPRDQEVISPSNTSNAQENTTIKGYEGAGAEAVRKNIYFWLFSIGYAIIAIPIAALSTQYATYFKSALNLQPSLIGILGSTFALFCLLGNVVGGTLFDKLGSLKTMAISAILIIIAIVSLLLAPRFHYISFLFSISYGLNVYSYMSGPAFMSSDVFGRKESSVTLGTISLLFALGFAFGSSLFGLIVDHFQFTVAWITMLICVVIGYALLLISIMKYKKQTLHT